MIDSKTKKAFKYWRSCKLPTCGFEFGTNRKWQEFCPTSTGRKCQQEWHKLLRRKHEDVIVELAIITDRQTQLMGICDAIIQTLGHIIEILAKEGYITDIELPEIPEIKDMAKKRPAQSEQK